MSSDALLSRSLIFSLAKNRLISTPGLPDLIINRSGNSVTVSWPATGTYTLQQNGNIGQPANWITSGYTITTSNGTNSITVTPPAGNLFFRLKQ